MLQNVADQHSRVCDKFVRFPSHIGVGKVVTVQKPKDGYVYMKIIAGPETGKLVSCERSQITMKEKLEWKMHDGVWKQMELPDRICGHCLLRQSGSDISPEKFKLCSGCERVHYCNRKCQKKHWPKHQTLCSLSSRSTGMRTEWISVDGWTIVGMAGSLENDAHL